MSNASMALLKGSPKKAPVAAAVAAELGKASTPAKAAKAAKAPVVEEEVKVDVDAMNEAGIAALVAEHDIEIPEAWSDMGLGEKKKWLNEQFGEDAVSELKPADAPEEVAAAPEPEVTKPKKAAKGKAVDTLGKTGEVLAPDLISTVAAELENLKEVEARKLVTELREGADFGFFKLGGVLSVIQSNNWIEPHGTFRDFVENEHGLNYRRAMYYIGIYNGLVESGIPWDEVKSLGWTKLKEIVPVLTKANVKAWVKTALKQTTLQLIETVKSHVAAEAQKKLGNDGATEPSLPVTTKTFKVHSDQKATIEAALAKAKQIASTTFDTVALDFICLDYLGGTGTHASVAGQLQNLGIDAALKAFEEAFPNVALTAEVDSSAEAA
jgi:hypothetical protein